MNEGILQILDWNVDGLPVPAGLSKDKKSPVNSAYSIVDFINKSGADIVSVQECFNFYHIYKKELNYENITEYNGGAAVGDGLAMASKFKMFNVKHIEWNEACGVLDCGSDELTPKGFMVATIEIAEGVYFDYYTLHADACEDEGSIKARINQFDQICEFIDSYSDDRAVIIAGDFNSNYSINLGDVLRNKFVTRGFKDTWVESENNGDYNPDYSELYSRYGNVDYWGQYDCIDKIYYRDGKNLKFSIAENKYEFCNTINQNGKFVLATDHAAVIARLNYKIEKADMKPIMLEEERIVTSFDLALKATKTITKDLCLLIKQVPAVIKGETKLDWLK